MGGTLLCRQCEPDVREIMDMHRAAGKPVNVGHIANKLYKETHSAGNYLLRDIPEDLWQRAKHRAVDDGHSLREMILLAIESYLR